MGKAVNKSKCNWRNAIVFIVLISLMECYFFRSVLGSDLLIGDLGDGRLCNLFAEHWYRFFQGKESAFDLRIFYPVQNTLAYSDCMLGFGIPYSVLRALGVSMYSAYKWVLIGFHVFGSICLYYLLNSKLKTNALSSFVGLVVFSYSNVYQVKATHTQLFATSLIPGLFLLIFLFFENFEIPAKRRIAGLSCILYVEYLLYTSYYPIFFLIFSLLVFTIITLIVFGREKINLLKYAKEYVNKNWLEVFVYLIAGVILTIPFLKLYLPAMSEFGERSWADVASMLPTLTGFVNVSNQNLFYGKLFSDFSPSEITCGFPLITFLLLLAAIIYYYNKYIQRKSLQPNGIDGAQQRLCLLTAISLTILCIFLLLVVDGKYSLWYIVYLFVPGASAIRACSRFFLFLALPIGMLLAVFTDELYQRFAKKARTFCLAILAILLLFFTFENTLKSPMSYWTVSDRVQFLESVPSPPEDCKVMYVLPDEDNKPTWIYQLDAWEIANKYDLKTINGYSGQFPPGWGLWEVSDEKYQTSVDRWCRDNQITSGIYAYDEATGMWRSHMDEMAYQTGDSVYFDGTQADAHQYFVEGMSGTEDGFAWTDGNTARFYAYISADTTSDLIMQINLRMIFNAPQHILVMSEDRVLLDDVIAEVAAPITIYIPAECVQDQSINLTFQFPDAISPKALGVSEDGRDLAFALEGFSIRERG